MHLPLQVLGLHVLFPRLHFVRITPDRVDFSVVDNEPIRVRPLPARVRVRGKPGVYHGNRRLVIFILQVRKEGAKLPHKEHALVHDSPARQTDHISHIRGLLKGSSQYIKLSVKVNAFLHTRRLFEKRLHDAGHTLHRLVPQH